jgi:hypothetical protein
MDAGEAEGSGREYLERWPRDRVILGSLHPYRFPPSPALWLRSLGETETPDLTWVRPFNFKSRPRSALFGPVVLQRSKFTPRRGGTHCAGITPLNGNTVTYSRIRLGNDN